MPLNYTKLEKRFSDCDKNLAELFEDQTNKTIQNHVKAVQEYYNKSYEKAKKDKTVNEIIGSYELYIEQLGLVKNGKMTSKDLLESINYANDSRKGDVLRHDLFKICELIFWAASALTLYTSIFLFALPMLIVQTPIGIGVSVVIGGLLIKTAANAIECFSAFRSWGRHSEEYSHEVELLGFFKPHIVKPEPENLEVNQELKTDSCWG